MIQHIAHVLRRFSFQEWGGTENVVWNLAQQQLNMDLKPEILCTAALNKPGVEVVHGITIRRFPYHYPYIPLSAQDKLDLDKKGGNPFSWKLLNNLKEGHYDVIHLHAGGRLAQYAAKLARKQHIPTVMSLHGGSCAIPQKEMELMLRPIRGKFSYGGIIDRICGIRRPPEEQVKALLALSKQETQLLKQTYPSQIIHWFPNGVNHRPLPVPDDSFRQNWNIPMDAKIILCISRIDYQKNQKILVKLMARLEQANHHLLLIGPITSQWYYNELLKMAQDLNVTDKLTIIPGLPPDSPQLLQALAQASCFILPSIHEPFGIAALEAMDAQLPLIAAKVGGLQDFLKHDENALLFASDNLDELYHCWQTLQKQDRHASALIKNGLETARRFDWQHLAKHLLKIYEELP